MKHATKDFAEAIRRKLNKNAGLAQAVERERHNLNVSQEVFRVRDELGLTQKQLADKIGTQQSVVARLESATYDGHSLKLLQRVAEAAGKRLEVRFVDSNPQSSSSESISPTIAVPKKATAKRKKVGERKLHS